MAWRESDWKISPFSGACMTEFGTRARLSWLAYLEQFQFAIRTDCWLVVGEGCDRERGGGGGDPSRGIQDSCVFLFLPFARVSSALLGAILPLQLGNQGRVSES